MTSKSTPRRPLIAVTVAAAALSTLTLAACDREVSTKKEESTKIVDTPEGKKKVTETTETTTIKEKKDNP